MTELQVVLRFLCRACEEAVRVTVKCEGKSLALAGQASVNVPCPSCGTMHRLEFEPSGTVCAVIALRSPRLLLEPSVN